MTAYDRLARMREDLQRTMLRNGGRLGCLDAAQIHTKSWNNNVEGESYSHPIEGEHLIMNNINPTMQSHSTEQNSVAPAGGQSDADLVSKLTGEKAIKPYSRIALETAIPTAIVVAGVVTAAVVVRLVDNKLGAGARFGKLVELGAFNGLDATESSAMLDTAVKPTL